MRLKQFPATSHRGPHPQVCTRRSGNWHRHHPIGASHGAILRL